MIIRIMMLLILFSSVDKLYAGDEVFEMFKDFIQFSSSVDAYSQMCVKGFNSEKAESDIFNLVALLNQSSIITQTDFNELKDKYYRIGQSTLTQLRQLGLHRNKNLCKKYLKIFERFDVKKNKTLSEIIEVIDENETR